MTQLIKFLFPLASPLGLGILLLLAATILLFWGRGRLQGLGRILVLASLAILLLGSLPFLSVPALRSLEYQHPHVEPPALREAGVRTVVVLGGGVAPCPVCPITSDLSRPSVLRLVEGIRLYRQIGGEEGARLILCGRGKHETEASQMALLATQLGVPDEDILLEEESMDTADQALMLKALLGDAPFALVTDASHMPRSMRAFQQMGLRPIAAPTAHLTRPPEETERLLSHLHSAFPQSENLRHLERALYERLADVRTRHEIARELEKQEPANPGEPPRKPRNENRNHGRH